ncbi:uncharacterized protein LOC129914746 [Episyrphus balteatus]|uniref:uncharacterized protein LOC129914746 n=1 Tax=Episyrphus balteatus TaxID=286459 RepID=UPI002485F46C|nr:uncharacterized protein LOC129914746 [Episyrphus balteatus]
MSFNNFNYIDGVPVKISEKYKPPPKVTIPQAVVNRLTNLTEDHYESPQYTYNFQLEKQVVKKLAEWKKVREIERENRRERIRVYELQKCRDNEAKQKQLLTAVSYPSAEDLSSDNEEEDNSIENKVVVVAPSKPDQSTHHSRQCFDTILQPTVASPLNSSYSTYSPSSVLIPSKINYSDFENDTSSPFDNIELKTINDLDILAQVLNYTQRHSASNAPLTSAVEEDDVAVVSKELAPEQSPPAPPPVVSSPSVVVNELSKDFGQVPNSISKSSNPTQEPNFYYNSLVSQTQALHVQQHPSHHLQHQSDQQNQYMMNYATVTHHNNMEPCSADLYFNYNNTLPETSNHNYLYGNYATQHQQQNSSSGGIVGMVHTNKFNNYPNGTFLNNYNCDSSRYGMQMMDGMMSTGIIGNRLEANEIVPKSKSKSVPDILKELKDEIRDSEIRRTRNNSQTIDDHSKRNSADSAQSLPSPNQASRSSSSSSTSFMKLSPSSQKLAKNISFMGFPLERVSKIAELYGNDDKKIIEHLIPLSELLDLGFDESKISEALVKFDNNKDRALDFLIS